MTRFTKWQREISDAVSWHQDRALNATIFLLRETGPTSFVIKEEDVEKRVRVTLGDPHTCTCDIFRRENVPCKHICWIILKKFKWPRNNELAFQYGLVEREINLLLRGPRNSTRTLTTPGHDKTEVKRDNKGTLKQREISNVDVCPICQDELLAKQAAVTFCKFGCGNSIHIKCMKIWAEHQRNSIQENEIKCPICRASFGSYYKLLEELRNSSGENDSGLDVHFSTSCTGCGMCPIKGKCYKCTTCESVFLCNTCFHGNKHRQHAFEFRMKRSQRWRQAKSRNSNPALEMSILNNLGTREITEDDYDLLLQLDRRQNVLSQAVDLSGLPLHVINSLPLMKVRVGARLLAPGKQCRICLRSYEVGQYVRKLPDCKHVFHKDCIDGWLSEDHRRCPIDQTLVCLYKRPPSAQEASPDAKHSSGDIMELIVPGVGIAKLQNDFPFESSHTSDGHSGNFVNFDTGNHALIQRMAQKARKHDHNHTQYQPSCRLSRRHHLSGSKQSYGNSSRINSAASQPQIDPHNRYGFSHSFERENYSSSTSRYHPMEAEHITRELSGVSLSKMLETIDGVLPFSKQQGLHNKTKQGVEKGLVSRRNIGQYADHQGTKSDSSLWLQGNSISPDESSLP